MFAKGQRPGGRKIFRQRAAVRRAKNFSPPRPLWGMLRHFVALDGSGTLRKVCRGHAEPESAHISWR